MPLRRRSLLWRRAALGALFAAVAIPCAAQRQPGPELQALLDTPVGQQPAAEMRWPLALEGIGREREAKRLRQQLLALWLRQAQGEAPVPSATIANLLARPEEEVKDRLLGAMERWPAIVALNLEARMPQAAPPLPSDLDYLRDRLIEVGPGIWLPRTVGGRAPGAAYAWIEWVNRGSTAFPTVPAQLVTPAGSWACNHPRGGTAQVLAAGAVAGMFCQGTPDAVMSDATVMARELPQRVRAGPWQARAMESQADRDALADTLAQPVRGAAEAWLAGYRAAVQGRASAGRALEQAGAAAKNRSERRRTRILASLGVIVGTVAYVLVARARGPVFASVLLWLLGSIALGPTGLALLAGARSGDGWSVLGGLIGGMYALGLPLVAAVLSLLIYRFVDRLWNEDEYRLQVVWSVALLLGLLALELLWSILSRSG